MRSLSYVAATTTCAAVLACAPVSLAQEAETPAMPEPAEAREEAPDTEHCPYALFPPQARTTSEVPSDGITPTPIPRIYDGPCGVIAPEDFRLPENVLASAWLVADVDSGEVLAMKDPHGRYRPASIIKVLLALTTIKELPLDKVVEVKQESADQVGSAVGVGEGGEYTVDELLHGLLLGSGNDAAHALAQELGGNKATLEKINQLAADLGATQTRAATYSGLDAPGMQTTAWDMALLYRAAYNDPTFERIANTEFIEFPGYGELPGYELWNDNQLFMYDPDGIGGKTGFTDDANHTFVGALDRDGRRIMAVILDTTTERGAPWQQAQSLINEGYHFAGNQAVADLDDEVAPAAPESAQAQETPDSPPAPTRQGLFADNEAGVGIVVVASVALLALVGSVVAWRANRRAVTSRQK